MDDFLNALYEITTSRIAHIQNVDLSEILDLTGHFTDELTARAQMLFIHSLGENNMQ